MTAPDTAALPADTPAPAPRPAFAGFWRRLAAFFVDTLVLGAVGLGLGWVAFDALAALGGWGRLLGFAIAVPYLGLMNSGLGDGRTLGKRLLRLRTVGLDGHVLSPGRGLLRAVVVCVPWFVNGAVTGPDLLQQLPVAIVLSLLIFCVGLGNLYLLAFNRPSRRGLHDWAVRSVVVHEPVAEPAVLSVPGWRGHRVVLGVLAVVAVAGPLAAKVLMASSTFEPVVDMSATVLAQPGVREAGLTLGKSWVSGSEGTRSYLSVQVFANSAQADVEALAQRVAAALIEHHPAAAQVDQLSVVVAYGYDIGISSMWRSRRIDGSPAQWLERARAAAGSAS